MPRRLESGALVDRYRVELVLGEGGMATVYRVRHQTLATVHALKVLHSGSASVRARLLDEGRLQATLRHPNIVPVTDVLEVDGDPALLMDFVAGGSLAERLSAGPELPLDEVERLFRGILAGVEAAHERGLVHRDLKPGNVLLDWPDDDDAPQVPRVTDFGLAKALDLQAGGPQRTQSGVALGTPAYMAPEQVRDAARVDHRADLFSLGALLYAMICGRSPFSASDRFSSLQKVVAGEIPDPRLCRPRLPAHLLAAVGACLQREPDHRPGSCAELRAVLDGATPATVAALAPVVPRGASSEATWDPEGPVPTPVPAQSSVVEDSLPESPVPAPAGPPATSATAVAPESAELRRAEVAALLVDGRGEGHLVTLLVEAWPGGRGVRNPTGADRDAEVAAQLAAAVVLGARADHWGVRWAARGHGFDLHGTSLGLAVAMGLKAAVTGRSVPPGWAFTGGLDLDGRVVPVAGVPAKLRAAAAAGRQWVAVPAEDADELIVPDGLRLVPVADQADLARVLFPEAAPRRPVPWRWGALLLPLLVGITDLGSPLDLSLQHPLLRTLRGPLATEDVAVVGIPPQGDLKSLRPRYPELLRELAAAGVTSVFWDILLSAPDPADEAIAAAVAEVAQAGMAVALPVRIDGGRAVLPGSSALHKVAPLGTVEARQDAVFGQVRGVPTSRRLGDGTELWHLAVWTAHGHVQARQPPREDPETSELVIGPLRNPSWAGEAWLYPTEPVLVVDWTDREAFSQLRGRAVVVGVHGGGVDRHRTPDGGRSGAELEAAMVQTLLRQAAPRRVPPELDALAALGLAGLLAAAGRAPRPWSAVGTALTVVGALGLVAALALANRVLAPTPLLVGLAVGLWLGRPTGAPPGSGA
jgi:serine/threonine-protein kinase